MTAQDVVCTGKTPVCLKCGCSKPHSRQRFDVNNFGLGGDIQYCTQWQECSEADKKVRCVREKS